MLTGDQWFLLVVLGAMFVGLFREYLGADVLLFTSVVLVWGKGIISLEEAVHGFANPEVLTIGLLFIVSAAVRETGLLAQITRYSLRPRLSYREVLLRILVPVSLASAFINNTPIVAMAAPAVRSWALRHKQSPSKFLIPLSYAAIVGGVCTLIGTATNLVVSGILEERGLAPYSMFELTPIGVPVAIAGLIFLMILSNALLPDRAPFERSAVEEAIEYGAVLRVTDGCPLIGKSVRDADNSYLHGLLIVEIERADVAEIARRNQVIAPVRPTDRIQRGDKLTLFGIAPDVVDLRSIPGLVPVSDDDGIRKVSSPVESRLFEVVISKLSRLVGQTVTEANFRRRYDAAVIAIRRDARKLHRSLDDIRLRPGDTLLVEASPGFRRAWRGSPDFYLIAPVVDAPERPNYRRSWMALFILVGMVLSLSFRWLRPLEAVAAASLLFIFTRCVRPEEARRSINVSILVVIASALAMSKAVVRSGLADMIAEVTVNLLGGWSNLAVLFFLYALTTLLTEVLSNTAAAALVVPVALSVAEVMQTDPRLLAITVTVAASMSFITPLGYQTNLLVYGPGGYRFVDFARIGIPMAMVCGSVALAMVSFVS